MTDYISGQAEIEALENKAHLEWGYLRIAIPLLKILETLPAADVAPIVRCGWCKYWQDNDGDQGYCYAKDGQGFGYAWGKNDFCSYGKRREE